jgi:formate/nitrite transporter FocA (FNT family)
VLILGSVGMLFFRQWRPWALAAIFGGLLGAAFAFVMFALSILLRDQDWGQLFSQVAAAIVSAGFGPGAVFGAAAFLLSRLMRTPSRWSDRHKGSRPLT